MPAKQSIADIIAAAVVRNATPYCGEPPTGGTLLDLLTRLYDDHQRVEPHHAHLCQLCLATKEAIGVAARNIFEEQS